MLYLGFIYRAIRKSAVLTVIKAPFSLQRCMGPGFVREGRLIERLKILVKIFL